MQSHRRNVALSPCVSMDVPLFPRSFCNSPLFFYPGRVHVAKSEMPPFQRTIPLYGSRNIWVAWLARLDFPSFPFFPSSSPPPLFWLSFYDPSKKNSTHIYDVNEECACRDFQFPLIR